MNERVEFTRPGFFFFALDFKENGRIPVLFHLFLIPEAATRWRRGGSGQHQVLLLFIESVIRARLSLWPIFTRLCSSIF